MRIKQKYYKYLRYLAPSHSGHALGQSDPGPGFEPRWSRLTFFVKVMSISFLTFHAICHGTDTLPQAQGRTVPE